jgi:PAS domain S-box-containing protein
MSELFKSTVERAKALEAEAPDAIISVFDELGHWLYVSPSHYSILGYAPDQLKGRHWTELVDESTQHRAHVTRALASLSENRPVSMRISVHTKAGKLLHLNGLVTQVRAGTEVYLLTQSEVIK